MGVVRGGDGRGGRWELCEGGVRDDRETIGGDAPQIEYPEPWHAHRGFVSAVVARLEETLSCLNQTERSRAHLIFTAHSIPVAMAADAPYVDQLTESARLVAARVGFPSWTLAFQSRSGNPREPWLEPDISTPAATL